MTLSYRTPYRAYIELQRGGDGGGEPARLDTIRPYGVILKTSQWWVANETYGSAAVDSVFSLLLTLSSADYPESTVLYRTSLPSVSSRVCRL
jgi:hypothetical protein